MALFDSLKNILGDRPDEEINGVIKDVKSQAPDASDDEIVNAVSNYAPAAKAGTLDKALTNNYVNSKYGLQQRQALENQIASENQGPNYGAGLAALGAGLAGGNAASAGQAYLANKKQDQNQRLNAFDTNAGLEKAENIAREENDPNSDASKMAQNLAIEMGVDPSVAGKLTAARFKLVSPVLQKKFEIAQKALDRKDTLKSNEMIAAGKETERQDKIRDKKEADDKIAAQKKEEYDLSRSTPYGLANTVDDAKKVKDAYVAKNNFDAKLNELISLREEFGGEAGNREAVARGKQLSKDLLLEYKNIAKLGVLSQSDEKIINAIIPDDPLAFNNPFEMATGQDPILANLKKFKADKDKDFENNVMTRVRSGANTEFASSPKPGPQVGVIEDGYRFKGGDPKDPANWEQMGSDPMLAAKR